MNLYLRLLLVLFGNLSKSRLHYSESVVRCFRVWPHDIDILGHMNNGRYHQIMDVARADWMLRTGVASAIRNNRWSPILGGSFVRFRQSLRMMQRYHVRTSLLCWDQRWFFLEHCFLDHRGECVAKGISRAALRKDGSWVHTDDVAFHVHPEASSPEMPGHVAEWMLLEDQMFHFDRHAAPPSVEQVFAQESALEQEVER
jgi:acyl-CoA thioesterase FadM